MFFGARPGIEAFSNARACRQDKTGASSITGAGQSVSPPRLLAIQASYLVTSTNPFPIALSILAVLFTLKVFEILKLPKAFHIGQGSNT